MDVWHVWTVFGTGYVPHQYREDEFIIDDYRAFLYLDLAMMWAHRHVGQGGGVYIIITKQRMWRWFDYYIDHELQWDYNNVVSCPHEYQWHQIYQEHCR